MVNQSDIGIDCIHVKGRLPQDNSLIDRGGSIWYSTYNDKHVKF
jgi:hypothetical protein